MTGNAILGLNTPAQRARLCINNRTETLIHMGVIIQIGIGIGIGIEI